MTLFKIRDKEKKKHLWEAKTRGWDTCLLDVCRDGRRKILTAHDLYIYIYILIARQVQSFACLCVCVRARLFVHMSVS